MKYEGKRKSGVDKDIDVYNFVFGIEELRTLKIALVHLQNGFPKITETQVIRSRLKQMLRTLEDFGQQEQRSLPMNK